MSQWHQVALTIGAGKMTLYVDGVGRRAARPWQRRNSAANSPWAPPAAADS